MLGIALTNGLLNYPFYTGTYVPVYFFLCIQKKSSPVYMLHWINKYASFTTTRHIVFLYKRKKIKINVCSFIIKKKKKARTLCRLFCLVFDDFYIGISFLRNFRLQIFHTCQVAWQIRSKRYAVRLFQQFGWNVVFSKGANCAVATCHQKIRHIRYR